MGGLSGCAYFAKPAPTESAVKMPTPAEQEFWLKNRDRAKYVPGRGYYVEGHSGYFDDNGRPLPTGSDSTGLVIEEEKSVLPDLSPKKAYKKFKKAIGKGPNEGIAKKSFSDAESLFRQSKYKEAAAQYTLAYDRWPDSPLEEEALYMAGECAFFSDQYVKADDAYALLVKKYASTPHLDKVVARRFSIARYWEQYHRKYPHYPVTPNMTNPTLPTFDTLGHALRVYERIRLDDPSGPLADDSLMATANVYFVQGRYEDADYYYGILRKDYIKSEHQFQAHLLGLRSKMLKYQGPDYEGAALDEADELITQLLAQFPGELGDEKDRILQARAEVRAQKALREYQIAEFYHKGKHYGASRIHYNNVAKNYPDTKLAQEARTKIQAVVAEPDHPKGKLDWLVDVLPESKKDGPTIAIAPPKPGATVQR